MRAGTPAGGSAPEPEEAELEAGLDALTQAALLHPLAVSRLLQRWDARHASSMHPLRNLCACS